MLKTNIFLIPFVVFSFFCHSSPTFTPGTPVVIPGSSLNVFGVTTVSASVNGYMALWLDSGSSNLVTSISHDKGLTWSPIQTVGPSIGFFGWVTGTQAAFVSGGVEFRPDLTNVTYFTSVYTPSAPSWTPIQNIGGNTLNFIDGSRGLYLAHSSSTILAAWSWLDQSNPTIIQYIYVNSSPDGINWFPEPVLVGSTQFEFSFPVVPSVCSKGSDFLITWLDNEFFSVQTSVSSDNGATWSPPQTIATPGFPAISSTQTGCFALPQGYMVSYRDDVSLYSIFSTDGFTWSTPTVVTSQVTQVVSDYIPAVSGNSCGFIIAWVGMDDNLYVSTSEDNGTTWDPPIAVTQNGSVYSDFLANVTISMYQDQCILGWRDMAGNAVACPATFSCTDKRKPNSGLFSISTPNNPRLQLQSRL